MLNVEEIKSIVKQIETQSEIGGIAWDQGSWVTGPRATKIQLDEKTAMSFGALYTQAVTEDCATTCCVAGFALMRAGLAYRGGDVLTRDGKYVGPVRAVAANLLGLDWRQADEIFSGHVGVSSKSYQDKVNDLKKVITQQTGITFDE